MRTVIIGLLWVGGAVYAHAQERPSTQQRPSAKKTMVVVVESTRVPRGVVKFVETALRNKVQSLGWTPIDPGAVASMRTMLKFPARPTSADWQRLGRSLLAERVLTATLIMTRRVVRVEVTTHTVGSKVATSRSASVTATELLATVLEVTSAVLGPAVVTPGPSSAPSVMPKSAPASRPREPAAAASTPSTRPTKQSAPLPATPLPQVAKVAPAQAAPAPAQAAPAPAKTAPAQTAPAPAKTASKQTQKRRKKSGLSTFAVGLRNYYLFDEGRGGPMLDVPVNTTDTTAS